MSLQRTGLPFGGFAVPYLEVAKVCAPNAAGQAVTANAVPMTCEIDTIVQNTAGGTGEVFNGVSIVLNQLINLPAGIYYFEGFLQYFSDATQTSGIFSLYNVTDSAYITRSGTASSVGQVTNKEIKGQFKITSAKTIDMRFTSEAGGAGMVIRSGSFANAFTLSTAGADQRTTLKLWKVG